MKQFPLKHFALYSKRWYKMFHPKSSRKTIWDDLRIILTADGYSGELMSEHDMMSVILHRCQDLEMPFFNNMVNFIDAVKPHNSWKYGYFTIEYAERYSLYKISSVDLPHWDMNTAVIYYCMSFIRNLEREFIGELPPPDYSILPRRNGISNKTLNKFFFQNR